MGIGGIGTWQLVILLLIVVLIFGTRRLSKVGWDVGEAIKGFRKTVKEEGTNDSDEVPKISTETSKSASTEKSSESVNKS